MMDKQQVNNDQDLGQSEPPKQCRGFMSVSVDTVSQSLRTTVGQANDNQQASTNLKLKAAISRFDVTILMPTETYFASTESYFAFH